MVVYRAYVRNYLGVTFYMHSLSFFTFVDVVLRLQNGGLGRLLSEIKLSTISGERGE